LWQSFYAFSTWSSQLDATLYTSYTAGTGIKQLISRHYTTHFTPVVKLLIMRWRISNFSSSILRMRHTVENIDS